MPVSFNGRMVVSFQILGTTPLEKLLLKMDNNAVFEKGRKDVVRARGAFALHGIYGCIKLTDGEG